MRGTEDVPYRQYGRNSRLLAKGGKAESNLAAGKANSQAEDQRHA